MSDLTLDRLRWLPGTSDPLGSPSSDPLGSDPLATSDPLGCRFAIWPRRAGKVTLAAIRSAAARDALQAARDAAPGPIGGTRAR